MPAAVSGTACVGRNGCVVRSPKPMLGYAPTAKADPEPRPFRPGSGGRTGAVRRLPTQLTKIKTFSPSSARNCDVWHPERAAFASQSPAQISSYAGGADCLAANFLLQKRLCVYFYMRLFFMLLRLATTDFSLHAACSICCTALGCKNQLVRLLLCCCLLGSGVACGCLS